MVQLELFTHRFAAVARADGGAAAAHRRLYQRQERLDFSVRPLDAAGELVVNAPHIPCTSALSVSASGGCARSRYGAGDVGRHNHPGSEAPIFRCHGRYAGLRGDHLLGFVASPPAASRRDRRHRPASCPRRDALGGGGVVILPCTWWGRRAPGKKCARPPRSPIPRGASRENWPTCALPWRQPRGPRRCSLWPGKHGRGPWPITWTRSRCAPRLAQGGSFATAGEQLRGGRESGRRLALQVAIRSRRTARSSTSPDRRGPTRQPNRRAP